MSSRTRTRKQRFALPRLRILPGVEARKRFYSSVFLRLGGEILHEFANRRRVLLAELETNALAFALASNA